MSGHAARAVIVVAALLFSLALSEALLHIIQPAVAYQYEPQEITVSHFQPSAYLPFELRPHHSGRFRMSEFDVTVGTNDLGLRDDPIDPASDRILCMGDSFTFGFGVEGQDTLCAQLEREFDGTYDVVNAGFADGNAPDTYAVWLARHRPAIAPRAIVVNLFQNDYSDVSGHEWQPPGAMPPLRILQPGTVVTPEGEWMRDSAVARLPPLVRRLLKRSYLVAILRDRWLQDAGATPGLVALPADAGPQSAAPADEPLSDDGRFVASLEMLRDSAGSTPLILHLIPFKGQGTESRMDRLVGRFGARHGIPVVQRYSEFTPADYFARDGHWIASGHAKAAGYLHATLTDLGF